MLACAIYLRSFASGSPILPSGGVKLTSEACAELYLSSLMYMLDEPETVSALKKLGLLSPDWVRSGTAVLELWDEFCDWRDSIMEEVIHGGRIGPPSPRILQIRIALQLAQRQGPIAPAVDILKEVAPTRARAKRLGRIGADLITAGDLHVAIVSHPGTPFLHFSASGFRLLPLAAVDALNLKRRPQDALDVRSTEIGEVEEILVSKDEGRASRRVQKSGNQPARILASPQLSSDPSTLLERRDALDALERLRSEDPVLAAAIIYRTGREDHSREEIADEYGVSADALRRAEKRLDRGDLPAWLRRLDAG